MKKLFNFLLVAILCFGLVGCGRGSTLHDNSSNDGNESKVIDITKENWDTYFEIKDDIHVNPVGDVRPDTCFVLKDKYKAENVSILLECTSTCEWHFVEIDNEEKKITVGELDENKTSEQRNSNRHIVGFDKNGGVKTSLIDSWQTDKYEDQMSLTIYKDFTITFIEGTLTLSK